MNPNHNTLCQISFKMNFNSRLFDMLPHHAFVKKTSGEYLYCNQVMAHDLGLSSTQEIVGLKDSDLVWTRFSKRLRFNDSYVLKKQEEVLCLEPVCLSSGKKVDLKSYKSPLEDIDNDLIGIIGFSYILSQNTNKDNLFLDSQLSKRQIQCLNLLVKGLTAKEIAESLKLSHRTVNDHLENAKIKLGCRNKAELIAIFSHQF